MKNETSTQSVVSSLPVIDRSYLDDADEGTTAYTHKIGINEEVVRLISKSKNEPEWMLQIRLKALELFLKTPTPVWGPSLRNIDFNKITYFSKPNAEKNAGKWEDVPENIKKTFDKLGIPEAEQKYLSGVGAQYDSEVVYHNLQKELQDQGVIFIDMDEAVHQYPELVKKYFMKRCIPVTDHKLIMLHAAVWSGGTFIYVPKNVKVKTPLQAYFRMNAKRGGQFEHTLIIADEGSGIQYIEGCSSPVYTENSLHAGCVELFVHKNARMRYSSVENWSKNTYNLNTKRAIVEDNGVIEWIGGNMGCLTGDSKIFTNLKGPITIKDLKIGDKVFALDEKSKTFKKAKVKAVINSGKKEVFQLRAAGREIKASANHPFLTLERENIISNKRKGKFITKWKRLDELEEGDLIAIAKILPDDGIPYLLPKISHENRTTKSKNQYTDSFIMSTSHLYNDITLPEYSNEDLMWFLGLYLGDGCTWLAKTGKAKINIAIPRSSHLRNPLIHITKKLFNYEITYEQDRFVIINSKIIGELLFMLGVSGTAKTKKIPHWTFSLPIKQKLALLAGLLDSDGHMGHNGVYITSISKELLEGIQTLAISCGIGVSRIFDHRKECYQEILGKLCHANDSFRILLNGEKVRSIPTRSTLYQEKMKKIKTKRNFSTKKGWNFRSKISDELGFARIDEIQSKGIEPTYDIEIEEFHNFISNGFVVHNSSVTMLYPSSILIGKNSRADHLGIAYAGKGQNQDTGSKVILIGENSSCNINSKSISKEGGICSYRGIVVVNKGAKNAKVSVNCDGLMMDAQSQSNTFPVLKVNEKKVHIAHEARVGKISDQDLFYLRSRGLTEEQAVSIIVSGFIEPVIKELPLEYAVEMNKLIELEMTNSLG